MGECFFWYRLTRVVPDKRPLNGCVCVCVCARARSRETVLDNTTVVARAHATTVVLSNAVSLLSEVL